MKGSVLLIEDNEQNCYLVCFLLERAGYTVIVAHDGHQGLARALDVRPDLILLDIQLPAMDGYAVAAALRQLPQMQGTPIIAVTSYAMAGDREKALAAGCTGYLEKPIDPDQFVDQIEALAGSASGAAP
jgi:CheY-like chemotaxis protein